MADPIVTGSQTQPFTITIPPETWKQTTAYSPRGLYNVIGHHDGIQSWAFENSTEAIVQHRLEVWEWQRHHANDQWALTIILGLLLLMALLTALSGAIDFIRRMCRG